jgi:hypothetical protein
MGFSFVAQQKGDFLIKKTDSTRPLINNWWWGFFLFASFPCGQVNLGVYKHRFLIFLFLIYIFNWIWKEVFE